MKGQGKIIVDGKEEVIKAGDAYYAPPGHTGAFEAGSEVWEFSPNEKLKKTMEVLAHNMELEEQKKA